MSWKPSPAIENTFVNLLEPNTKTYLGELAQMLGIFDMSTLYPLLLHLQNAKLSDDDWFMASQSLQSYVIRRAVCGLTTKSYNRLFLSVIRRLQTDGSNSLVLRELMSSLRGETQEWPNDSRFAEAWGAQIYSTLGAGRIAYILRRINETFLSGMHEDIQIDGGLTIEHIMPQSWIENWPLKDGTEGVPFWPLTDDPENVGYRASRERDRAINSFGNLTILTRALNSSISNGPWPDKKKAILTTSLLPINQLLYDCDVWDEAAIAARGHELFRRAVKLWPGPDLATVTAIAS